MDNNYMIDSTLKFSVENAENSARIHYNYYTDMYKSAYICITDTKVKDSQGFLNLLKSFAQTIYVDTKRTVSARVAIATIMDVGYDVWSDMNFSIVFESEKQETNYYEMIKALNQ